ncbi:hypothetical protein [Mycobacterium haemophilum]|nr:hypothetical protein [Mycobacterium haemophilum]
MVKVLAALADSDMPHHHLIASCADPTVLGDAAACRPWLVAAQQI